MKLTFIYIAVLLMIFYIYASRAGDIFVNERLISVSPPDEKGVVTVVGSPGAVQCDGLAVLVVENDDTDQKIKGTVRDNGGFSAKIRASSEDKLKIKFVSALGDKERVKIKVPMRPVKAAAGSLSPSSRRIPEPTPEIVIRYRKQPIKRVKAVDPELEVRQSGVLPPE